LVSEMGFPSPLVGGDAGCVLGGVWAGPLAVKVVTSSLKGDVSSVPFAYHARSIACTAGRVGWPPRSLDPPVVDTNGDDESPRALAPWTDSMPLAAPAKTTASSQPPENPRPSANIGRPASAGDYRIQGSGTPVPPGVKLFFFSMAEGRPEPAGPADIGAAARSLAPGLRARTSFYQRPCPLERLSG